MKNLLSIIVVTLSALCFSNIYAQNIEHDITQNIVYQENEVKNFIVVFDEKGLIDYSNIQFEEENNNNILNSHSVRKNTLKVLDQEKRSFI